MIIFFAIVDYQSDCILKKNSVSIGGTKFAGSVVVYIVTCVCTK